MNFKCLLGFHDWSYDRGQFAFKCSRCGKIKATPLVALANFLYDMLGISMKADAILALLRSGRIKEAEAKLEEWKKEVNISFNLKTIGELELNPGDCVVISQNAKPRLEYTAPANTKTKLKIMAIEKQIPAEKPGEKNYGTNY